MTPLGVGILVGGQGSRLGGAAKGLLRLPNGTTLLDRLLAEVHAVVPSAPVYLVGNRAEYATLGPTPEQSPTTGRLPVTAPRRAALIHVADDPADVGPLGGLHALLQRALAHQPCDEVLMLGCDLPYLSRAVITRLLAAPLTTAVAARTGTPPRWEPMLARYRVTEALPVVKEQLHAGALGLFALLNRLNATPLELSADEAAELRDWDTPDDVARGNGQLP